MAISTVTEIFDCDIQKVWNIVTSLENYSWRSDLSKIEVLNEKQFIEHTKDGFATTFTITTETPYKRWEFNLENKNIIGNWIGVFSEKNGKSEITFTENIKSKKFFMKPFVKGFLKRQQALYIADLRKAINQ